MSELIMLERVTGDSNVLECVVYPELASVATSALHSRSVSLRGVRQ